jgi:hypothetical protein
MGTEPDIFASDCEETRFKALPFQHPQGFF